jgi:hypothetical protein
MHRGGIPGGYSKPDEIHIKNASVTASSQQSGAAIGADTACNSKTPVSMVRIDGGHVTLSSISGAGIETRSAMVNLGSDVSSSSDTAIHIKDGSFRVLPDECGTGMIPVI